MGEDRAVEFLMRQGFTVLARNYRCRFGEADIVAGNGAAVYLVEVKARGSSGFGLPAEAIGRAKLRRMERVALSWWRERGGTDQPRLAVVTILGDEEPQLITEIEAVD